MDLLLSDAARLLDKSESQVRYLIKSGQLQARKVRGRWQIKREDLPLSRGQLRAAERKIERAERDGELRTGRPGSLAGVLIR